MGVFEDHYCFVPRLFLSLSGTNPLQSMLVRRVAIILYITLNLSVAIPQVEMNRTIHASITRLNPSELRLINRPTNLNAFLFVIESRIEGEEVEQESPESPTPSNRGPSPPPRQRSPPPAQQFVPEIIDLTSPSSSSVVAASPSSTPRSRASSSSSVRFTPLSDCSIDFSPVIRRGRRRSYTPELTDGNGTELTVGNVIAVIDPSSLTSIFPTPPALQLPILSNAVPPSVNVDFMASSNNSSMPLLNDNAMPLINDDAVQLLDKNVVPSVDNDAIQPMNNDATQFLDGNVEPSLDNDAIQPMNNHATQFLDENVAPSLDNNAMSTSKNDDMPSLDSDAMPHFNNTGTPEGVSILIKEGVVYQKMTPRGNSVKPWWKMLEAKKEEEEREEKRKEEEERQKLKRKLEAKEKREANKKRKEEKMQQLLEKEKKKSQDKVLNDQEESHKEKKKKGASVVEKEEKKKVVKTQKPPAVVKSQKNLSKKKRTPQQPSVPLQQQPLLSPSQSPLTVQQQQPIQTQQQQRAVENPQKNLSKKKRTPQQTSVPLQQQPLLSPSQSVFSLKIPKIRKTDNVRHASTMDCNMGEDSGISLNSTDGEFKNPRVLLQSLVDDANMSLDDRSQVSFNNSLDLADHYNSNANFPDLTNETQVALDRLIRETLGSNPVSNDVVLNPAQYNYKGLKF
ncbi:hypothetical protein QAD02_011168 [Eretmocerus hayati]|uniref:Uncharacterized protein n=1 Tax=Eretmocerus hayati TaxID=131215 RepID=A0ACC2NW92_9HYME|nr:hypothetical protein QAD02_011168 [Eretmocerus hayati]